MTTYSFVTPGGQQYTLYADMLQQTHILIAGATGSGKSVVINGLIHTALLHSPAKYEFMMIDLKRVELCAYKNLPHTAFYADNISSAISGLTMALDEIDRRYRDMQVRGLKKYDGSCLYVVIDELADLMTTCKKELVPLLQRLAQIGRAANVHIIAATQCPLSKIIPTEIKVNFDAILGLKTVTAQHSRNIIDQRGCEGLPPYGYCYYMTPAAQTVQQLPMIEQRELDRVAEFWNRQRRH